MCGIYGVVSRPELAPARQEALESMGRQLRHRGPDAHGVHSLPHAAFGCERLRVYDTTSAGDQPFVDPTGRVMLVLNGAIYNAPALRALYPNYPFSSRTDAESLMPLYLDRGVDGVRDLDGMFAFAIYDGRTGQLLLARDRAGEKPLFYRLGDDEVWFASEVQPLLDGAARGDLNPTALHQMAALGYVTEPLTMFNPIKKVQAGTVQVFGANQTDIIRYWDPATDPACLGCRAASAKDLEELLVNAVSKQLTADVPVGIFSSGGIDSGLLTAIALQERGKGSVGTFTVGFAEKEYDESPQAERLARQLGAEHQTVRTDETTLLAALHHVVDSVAEPIADPAVLPTYLLARAAREHVTVVLSGEGADELFGGYPTYLGHRLAPWFNRLPAPVRKAVAGTANLVPVSQTGKVPLEYLLRRFMTSAELTVPERHLQWFGTGIDPELLTPETREDEQARPRFPATGDPISAASLFDYSTYLRDNLLTKVDRATMLSSLEARAPFLDREITRFGLSLDPTLKVRGARTKWLLNRVARRWLPSATTRRRKRGLSVPIAKWLNGVLREDVDTLLSPERAAIRGLVRPEAVRRLISEHRSRTANHSRALWPLLVLEYWIERWVPEG